MEKRGAFVLIGANSKLWSASVMPTEAIELSVSI